MEPTGKGDLIDLGILQTDGDGSEYWIGFGVVDKLPLLSQITFAYTFFLKKIIFGWIFSCRAYKLLADASNVASIIIFVFPG